MGKTNKKIGILTFFYSGNYGATLQAYALKEAINQNGYGDAHLINYRSKVKTKKSFKHKIISFIESIYYFPRMKKTLAFAKSVADPNEVSKEGLTSLNDEFDIFLSGSDQIWNPDISNGDCSYLLDFVTDNQKKRSYGSSFGVSKIPESCIDTYKKMLSAYEEITVRENNGALIIKQLIDKDVEVVVDPVLLLTREQWESMLDSKVVSKKPYTFTYQMAKGPLAGKITRAAKKELKSKSIYVPFPILGYCPGKYVLGYSSLQWLKAIHDSSFVITDSFHATVFAILFNIPFYYVVASEVIKKRLSRVETLLTKLGLTDCIVENVNQCDFAKKIDFESVNKVLNEERTRSLLLLENICKK